LQHLNLPPLGWAQRNFPLLTQSLLFAATQAQWDGTGNSPRGNAIEVTFEKKNPFLRAFDPDNGQLISRTELPSNAQGAPISYMADGKQFIVIPIGGANRPAELIALSLP
jgi:quinoprotein glucose dehydrogenase